MLHRALGAASAGAGALARTVGPPQRQAASALPRRRAVRVRAACLAAAASSRPQVGDLRASRARPKIEDLGRGMRR